MAGIGFSLKTLFSKKGVLNLCKAYGYAGVVTSGPMILGMLMLIGLSFVARVGNLPETERNLLNCMLTYSLLVSLFVSTWFNMVVTRFVSDMLYEDRPEKIMPSFFGTVAIEIILCLAGYGTFLAFTDVPLICKLLCLWLAMSLLVVWTEMIYLTALKDFQSIILTFAICLLTGFLAALILLLRGLISMESLMLCMILAYGLLGVRLLQLMLSYFPRSEGSHFSFLKWFDRYPSLTFSGIMVEIGLFSHLIIMYFGPLGVQVRSLFYGSPEYDVPALISFFSLLITNVGFVTSAEVNFYPKYSNYYGLFSDRGTIHDIQLAEKEMLDVLRRELVFLGSKQLFTTLLFIVIGTPIVSSLFPGTTSLSLSIYRLLCVGYGLYAVGNTMMLIGLYFEDYLGAALSTGAFGLISTAMNIWQINCGSVSYYGFGFLVGALAFFFIALVRLNWYARRLPYFLLARQSLVPGREKGLFTAIATRLDARQPRVLLLLLLLPALLLNAGGRAEAHGEGRRAADIRSAVQEDQSMTATPDVTEAPGAEETRKVAEKAPLTEGNLRDNMALYANQDDLTVLTMYLTVTPGNAADGSDHTWTEVNTCSVADYEAMGTDRYMVEGLLQIDETGEGVTEASFGYGVTDPNVSVQIRGQTSSAHRQKNYKIRIKKGMGSFRAQRTLNLNKHAMIPFRFTNKLCYRWVQRIPQLIGGRTELVHLFVRDLTAGGNGEWTDYGLYTMVEQVNRTFLKNHLLDENGQLYKVTFFEWDRYEAVMIPEDDPAFDRAAFESYLEIKGHEDHGKLREVVKDVSNYLKPIQVTVAEHFNAENLCYYMAFNILTSNHDSHARNLFLYSPLNSPRFYVIPWDLDSALRKNYLNTRPDYGEADSWERGFQLFLGLRLTNRMLKEPVYRDMLTAAVEDLYRNYLTREIVLTDARRLSAKVKPFLFNTEGPDYPYLQVKDEAVYDSLVETIPDEIARNYAYYYESLDKPWPFFVDMPVRDEATGQLILSWGISYDPNGEPVTYDYVLARDMHFTDVVAHREQLTAPTDAVPALPPGSYFLKVISRNASGLTMDCFDYLSTSDYGKIYGCHAFTVAADGTVGAYTKGD